MSLPYPPPAVAGMCDEQLLEAVVEVAVPGAVPGAQRAHHHSSGSFASIDRTLSRVQVAQSHTTPRSLVSNDQPGGSSSSCSARAPQRPHAFTGVRR